MFAVALPVTAFGQTTALLESQVLQSERSGTNAIARSLAVASQELIAATDLPAVCGLHGKKLVLDDRPDELAATRRSATLERSIQPIVLWLFGG